jgi:hypothetical protein
MGGVDDNVGQAGNLPCHLHMHNPALLSLMTIHEL